MRIWQMKTKSLVAAVVLAAALAGCGPATDPAAGGAGASTPPTTPPSAGELLVKSVPAAGSVKYGFAVKGGDTPLNGVLDASGKAYRYDVTQVNADPHFKMTMNFLFVGEKSWVKIGFSEASGLTGLPKLPAKWMLLDKSKLKGDDALPTPADDESDPGAAGAIMAAIVDAKQTTPGHFTGTTDLTRQPDAGIVDEKTLKALGAKAKSLAFRADTDASGRLTSVIVDIPAVGKTKAHRYAVSYRDYGTVKSPVEPSAAEQQKAPAAAYDLLNG
jgi:hypothetical protein